MAFYVIMPDEHIELIVDLIGKAREVYENFYPDTSADAENVNDVNRCCSIEEFLTNCAKEMLAYQSGIINNGKVKVSKVYIESKENDLTKELYKECLGDAELIWLHEDFYGTDILRERAESGRTDEFYYSILKDWEKYCVDIMDKNPPVEGTIGVVRIGKEHVGYVAKALEDRGHTVKVLPYKDYKSKIEAHLNELGVDVEQTKFAALARTLV